MSSIALPLETMTCTTKLAPHSPQQSRHDKAHAHVWKGRITYKWRYINHYHAQRVSPVLFLRPTDRQAGRQTDLTVNLALASPW